MTTEYALEIEGLTKVYPNGMKAVNDINLKIEKGDFFALLGHNGAGKSTTINIISSIIKKTSGKIKIFGHDLDTELQTCKTLIGVVEQEENLMMGITLIDILVMQGGLYGIPTAEAQIRGLYWLEKMELLDKVNSTVRELSGGMVRRFMIACAMMHFPRLLILDEPTAGVDVSLRRDMWHFLQEINKLGVTIILTTHYLEEAEYLCRNVAIIKSGEIKANSSMKDLISSLNDDVYTLDVSGYNGQDLALEKVKFNIIDNNTIEVLIERGVNLSQCFSYLESQGISVYSLKNTQNRLERIFMQYEEKGN